jgi:hypothetical protein
MNNRPKINPPKPNVDLINLDKETKTIYFNILALYARRVDKVAHYGIEKIIEHLECMISDGSMKITIYTNDNINLQIWDYYDGCYKDPGYASKKSDDSGEFYEK